MKIVSSISNSFKKISSVKCVLIFTLLFLAAGYLMESSFVGSARLKEISGGTGMIDMQFYYCPNTAYGMLNAMGAKGRDFYAKLLCLDFLFSVFFMLAHSSFITLLLRNLKINNKWLQLNTLPVFRSLFDVLENCFLFIMIFNYPKEYPVIATIATIMTAAKWLIYVIALMVTFVLLILAIYKRLHRKSI